VDVAKRMAGQGKIRPIGTSFLVVKMKLEMMVLVFKELFSKMLIL
jgi:hypothetical protein